MAVPKSSCVLNTITSSVRKKPMCRASMADVATLAMAALVNQLRMNGNTSVAPAASAAAAPRTAPSFKPPAPGIKPTPTSTRPM
jgi:hypothetical protein